MIPTISSLVIFKNILLKINSNTIYLVINDARRNYYENEKLTDPEAIKEKIEFALSAADVMEKYVIQGMWLYKVELSSKF